MVIIHDSYNNYNLRSLEYGDVEWIASNLRESDVIDIKAVTIKPPLEAIRECVESANFCYVADYCGVPLALIGLEETGLHGQASIWMIGTERLSYEWNRGLMRVTLRWFRLVSEHYSDLFNFVPELNQQDINWLQYLGFQKYSVIENYRGLGFKCFEMRLTR